MAPGVAVALAVAGCGGDDDRDLPDPPATVQQAAPTSTLTADEAAAVTEILASYDGYRELLIELQGDPDGTVGQIEPLAGYLSESFASFMGQDIIAMPHLDVRREGRPTWDPDVVSIQLAADPRPTATLRDCFDGSGWGFVDGAGDPVDYGSLAVAIEPPPDRHVREYAVEFFDDLDGWRFVSGGVEEGETC